MAGQHKFAGLCRHIVMYLQLEYWTVKCTGTVQCYVQQKKNQDAELFTLHSSVHCTGSGYNW